jgi:hypothetical protein
VTRLAYAALHVGLGLLFVMCLTGRFIGDAAPAVGALGAVVAVQGAIALALAVTVGGRDARRRRGAMLAAGTTVGALIALPYAQDLGVRIHWGVHRSSLVELARDMEAQGRARAEDGSDQAVHDGFRRRLQALRFAMASVTDDHVAFLQPGPGNLVSGYLIVMPGRRPPGVGDLVAAFPVTHARAVELGWYYFEASPVRMASAALAGSTAAVTGRPTTR